MKTLDRKLTYGSSLLTNELMCFLHVHTKYSQSASKNPKLNITSKTPVVGQVLHALKLIITPLYMVRKEYQ